MVRALGGFVFGSWLLVACGGDTTIDLLPQGGGPGRGGSGGSAGGGTGGIPCSPACSGERPKCDATRGACVVCLVAADCPHAGDACDPSGFCSDPCSTSTQCTSGSKAHCDPNSGACVECLEASHCSDEPYCILGRCAECTQSSECAAKSPDKPFCGVLHQCVECLRDADCASGICDLNEGHCKGG